MTCACGELCVEVNKDGGSNVSFRKYGPVSAWKLSLLFAGWVQPPRPTPNMQDEIAVKEAVKRLELPPRQ